MNREQAIKYCLAIYVVLITFFVYIPSLQNGFVNWDDGMYVNNNFFIRSLDLIFFKWAFFSFHASNWHPLTWITHAIDYALWGLNPLGHHLTNNILHGINSFLVVLLIVKLLDSSRKIQTNEGQFKGVFSDKGILIAAGVTGLLFGIHPIHVESVAWVSERKDVLYAFFYLLSLLTYISYIKEAGRVNKQGTFFSIFSSRHYKLTLFLFVLSLMSKPMAVTLPVILLILDWYPFSRFERGRLGYVFMEKLPFLLLALGSAIITILAQQLGGAIQSFTEVPLSARLLIGLKALMGYLSKMIYPINLSPFYPYPQNVNMITLLSYKYLIPFLLVIGITSICIIFLKRQKIWSAIWGYYLMTLLPVLGIIRVGSQEMADRYAYLPSIGPFLIIGLSAAWITDKRLKTSQLDIIKKLLSLFVAILLIGVLSYATIRQTLVWKNSETLWNQAITIHPGLPSAYNNRGEYYRHNEQYEKAIDDFTKGISIKPDYVPPYINRARAYAKLGRYEDALNDAQEAVRLNPRIWKTYFTRGDIYAMFDRDEEAIKDYTEAIKLNTGLPEIYNNRGMVYAKIGLLEKAIYDYTRAINLSPLSRTAYYYYNRGVIYKLLGKSDEAMKDFLKAKNILNNP